MINRAHQLAVVLSLALSRAALAADDAAAAHGEAQANPMDFQAATFIAALVLFGVVVFILNKYAWPPITKALADREQKIRSDIEEAEMARKQANAALQQYEAARAEARTEAARIMDEAKADAQKIAAELRARAESEIVALKDSAARDIESARRAALSEIYAQTAETASAIAGKILEREINPEDHRKLVDESLAELQGAGVS